LFVDSPLSSKENRLTIFLPDFQVELKEKNLFQVKMEFYDNKKQSKSSKNIQIYETATDSGMLLGRDVDVNEAGAPSVTSLTAEVDECCCWEDAERPANSSTICSIGRFFVSGNTKYKYVEVKSNGTIKIINVKGPIISYAGKKISGEIKHVKYWVAIDADCINGRKSAVVSSVAMKSANGPTPRLKTKRKSINTTKNAYPVLTSSVNLNKYTKNISSEFNAANASNPPIINFRLPILSIVKVPTTFPNNPENDAKQFAIAAPFSVNPIPCNKNVPKNETAIIPENDTVVFTKTQIKNAFRAGR
jgi:hypothetical protein